MTEETLFQEALARSPEERAAFLEQACAGKPELRAAVEALLAAHEQSENLLDQPPVALGQTSDFTPEPDRSLVTGAYIPLPEDAPPQPRSSHHPPASGPGAVIAGRYTLVEKLGEGGMGEVWVAQQTEPVKRKVALKLIKTGMDSKGVLARFDAERQALALMDHPHIARVYDGGTTAAGQPFFVMELVQGVPLTDYCDHKRLSVKARLELFGSVCQAVQHAHQKGIIHRDLKPGNVLVTEVDGRPTPKVIDFGVAKATEQKLTEMSFSDVGAIVGTPAYMSPEQADPTSMDIDTRTDVYALGVMLYELLTGSPPIDAKQFKRGAILEMLRMVREVEPPRPSTRLSTADALPSIAANRSVEPARLTKLLKRELDWVVMKALEKDRARRYDTVNGLARDLQRYLTNEVVEARPPSAGYWLRKFVSRNKAKVTAACLVLLTLVGGIIGTTFGLLRANEAAAAELAANLKAQARLIQIEKGNEVLTSIFNDLDIRAVKADKDPLEAVLAKRLVKAAQQLEGEAIGDPLTVADLQEKLAWSLISLGYPVEAIPLLEKARQTRLELLGKMHPDTQTSMYRLAAGYWEASQYDRALPLHQETLELRKTLLGPEHPDTLKSMHSLAATYHQTDRLKDAHELYDETLKLRTVVLGTDHQDTLKTMNNLANVYCHEKKYELGLTLHEETLKRRRALMGDDHPDTFISRMAMASGYRAAGKQDRAKELEEESLKLMTARLGVEHPSTLMAMTTLANTYATLNKHEQVLPLHQDILRLRRARLGESHPETIASMHSLANTYFTLGKHEEVLPLHQEALRIRQATLGPKHTLTQRSMTDLANAYRKLEKHDLALPLLEEVLRLKKAEHGDDHRETYSATHSLSAGYCSMGQHQRALDLEEEAVQRARAKFGPDSPEAADCLDSLTLRCLEVSVHQAWFRNDGDLAATAERMLLYVRGTQTVAGLERAAKAWSLLKSAAPERRAEVLAMARQAVELGKSSPFMAYFQMAQGMAEYRSGMFTEAAATLAATAASPAAKDDPHVLGTAGFYRAMSLHRLGKLEEARALATVQEMAPLPADENKPLVGRASIDDLIVWMAYKEAKELIGFAAEPAPAKKPKVQP